MLGFGFLFGGLRYREQTFNSAATKEIGTLLLLAALSIVLPTMFHAWSDGNKDKSQDFSRGIAIVLIVTYLFFRYFQLFSHGDLFEGVSTASDDASSEDVSDQYSNLHNPQTLRGSIIGDTKSEDAHYTVRNRGSTPPHPATLVLSLLFATALIYFHSNFATDNLQGVMEDGGIGFSFLGVVILPLLSNDIGPIRAAWEDRTDRCIASTVGKCVQMALLIIPLIIIISWSWGVNDMSLNFDGFEAVTLFLSSVYVNFVIINGKSN